MTKPIDEYGAGYEAAMSAYPTVNDVSELPMIDPALTTAPADVYAPSQITVYSNNITPVAYNPDDTINAFDIVFSVQVVEGSEVKTYQVVKRIGIDKVKLAQQAQFSTPITVVESKKPSINTKNWRRIAGLE